MCHKQRGIDMKCHWFQCGGWISEGYCVKCGRSGNLAYELGVRNKQDQHNILEPEHGPLWKGKGHEAGYQKEAARHRGANKRRVKSGSKDKAK